MIHTYADCTPKQVAYAESLARKAGYKYLAQARTAMNGKNRIGAMKRAECSDLIKFLGA